MNNERIPDVPLWRLLREGRQRLAATETETQALDAEVLLRHVTGLDRTALFARLPESLPPAGVEEYQGLLAARAAGTPVAYLTGEREFMGLSFSVGPGVLIPRPETEILVEWALAWLRSRPGAIVVDVGTGSGAIAISVAAGLGADWQGRILAVDASPDALRFAALNQSRLLLDHPLSLVHDSLLDWRAEPVDLLLANLPYLRPTQIAANPLLAAEPALALDGGADGLDLIRTLLLDAPRLLSPGGAIGLEIDSAQRGAVVDLAREAFPEAQISVLPDLASLDRHVIVQTMNGRDAG